MPISAGRYTTGIGALATCGILTTNVELYAKLPDSRSQARVVPGLPYCAPLRAHSGRLDNIALLDTMYRILRLTISLTVLGSGGRLPIHPSLPEVSRKLLIFVPSSAQYSQVDY